MKNWLKKIVGLVLFSIVSFAYSLEVPPLERNFCHDTAGFLTEEQVKYVEGFLKNLNEISKVQLALLTIPSLEDEVLEDYSVRVFNTWKLGDAKENSGALLLISQQERKLRVEIGYGLEGVLTDAVAAKIIREVIGPAFKKNDYYTGIMEGLRAIQAYALQDESLIATVEEKAKADKKAVGKKGEGSPWTTILTVFGVFVAIIYALRQGHFSRDSYGSSRRRSRQGFDTIPTFGGVSGFSNRKKDESFDDGPLGKGGSCGGGGASGGW